MSDRGGKQTIGIAGTGLIGAGIGLASRAAGITVVGWDPSHDALRVAQERGAIDQIAPKLEALLRGVDGVVVSGPPDTIAATLETVIASAGDRCWITDVTSAKAPFAPLARRCPRYVPGHPMAGSERHGPSHASGEMFRGAVWALCPADETTALEPVAAWVRALGAVPLIVDAKVHDRTIALTSHLPHVLAFLLYRQAVEADLGSGLPVFELAAGGFHSATRVAASSPDAWGAILAANRDAVLESIANLRGGLDDLAAALEAGDDARLRALLREGMRHPDQMVRYPAG